MIVWYPDWAGGPLAQSALLYKRMAFAATTNTMRNLSIAVQTGTMLRPLMFGLGWCEWRASKKSF